MLKISQNFLDDCWKCIWWDFCMSCYKYDLLSNWWTSLFRPHRSTSYVDVACCYRPSSVICLSVCQTSEACKNGWTDQDAIWVEDLGGPREPCVRWGKAVLMGRGVPFAKYRSTLRSSVQCKNGWTYRYAVWVVGSDGPRETLRSSALHGAHIPHGKR